jgi:hypothetical protein
MAVANVNQGRTTQRGEATEKLGLKIEQLCALLTMATDGSFDTHSEGTKEGYLFACADIAQECERLLTALEATHA